MKDDLTVGDASAKPGTKQSGLLKIGERADGSPLDIPIMAVSGLNEGPRLWIQAGLHGDEYDGIDAIVKVAKNIDPKKVNGNIIFVPAVNVAGFQANERRNPCDHLNLNRCFPGKSDGQISEQIAYAIFKEVETKADYVIDLHSGGSEFRLYPFTIFHSVGGKVEATSKKLAEVFGTKVICKSTPESGWLDGSMLSEATKEGIPSIIAEAGGEGRLQNESVRIHQRGILSIMQHLHMISGASITIDDQTLVSDAYSVRAKCGGLLYTNVAPGDVVSGGNDIAHIGSIYGENSEVVKSPITGESIAIGVRTIPVIDTGRTIALLSKIERLI